MKLINEYLSDDELEQLILDVEQNELVPAPPDLLDNIMASVEAEQESCRQLPVKMQSAENRVLEFRRYRFRVWTSVAAAVVMVFLLPKLVDLQQTERLNDTGILTEIFGGVNIFDNEDNFNFFNG